MIRDMSPSERCAYDEGIKAAIAAARIVAITIETADDANTFRKQVAAETLAAFAEAAEELKLAPRTDPVQP
jgi:tRNA U34 2-thiouridine synthase MnmA/TrmU